MDLRKRARWLVPALWVTLLLELFIGTYVQDLSPARGQHFVIAIDTEDSGPFAYISRDGELAGLDVEILNTIAEDQDFTVSFEQMPYKDALAALRLDRVDAVMSGLGITPEREVVFDFSDPYLAYGTVLATDIYESGITSYEDLRGKRVAVLSDSVAAEFAESIERRYAFTLAYYDDVNQMFRAIRANEVQAFFDETVWLRYDIADGIDDMQIVTAAEPDVGIGLAVNQGQNADLVQGFNDGLREIKKSEKHDYDDIVEKYLGPYPREPFDWNEFGLVLLFNSWWIVPGLVIGVRAVWVKLRPRRTSHAPGADEEFQDAL